MRSLKSMLALAALSLTSMVASAAYVSVETPADGIELGCPNQQNIMYLRPAPADLLNRYSTAFRELTGRVINYGGAGTFETAKRFVADVQKSSCGRTSTLSVLTKAGEQPTVYFAGNDSKRFEVRGDPGAKALNLTGLYWLYANEAGKPELMYGPFALSPEFLRNGQSLLLESGIK
jgi:hypothetical protein